MRRKQRHKRLERLLAVVEHRDSRARENVLLGELKQVDDLLVVHASGALLGRLLEELDQVVAQLEELGEATHDLPRLTRLDVHHAHVVVAVVLDQLHVGELHADEATDVRDTAAIARVREAVHGALIGK